MLAQMRWRVLPAIVVLALAACRDNPNIDGTKVAPSAATCPEVCTRLVSLCGYAPPNCADEEGGYCTTNLSDDAVLTCMSTAASCQAAWDCPNAVTTPTDDASADASDETTPDDASDGAAQD
jgi:hypothetical protein